ncbi:methylated-DNA--[protein]-cysteine S-methyltransferase [Benzoatithermus flavus]|uniref:Methylated-DNA--protein-cysteine methyltransferase n=1 Tax=Benzoatithermus flavus TaxID=3108223 RepID=A0ABU8XTL4_9PROT
MAEPLRLLTEEMPTPIGDLVVVSDEAGHLRAVDWVEDMAGMERLLSRHYGAGGFVLRPAPGRTAHREALEAYFAGDLHAIDDLPTATGGSPFQRQVWQALRRIPCGETISYATLARRIGRPAAVRAVGLANGANPIAIVVPCHRVIGADGSLTGYGGGLPRKRWLLAHESWRGTAPELPLGD